MNIENKDFGIDLDLKLNNNNEEKRKINETSRLEIAKMLGVDKKELKLELEFRSDDFKLSEFTKGLSKEDSNNLCTDLDRLFAKINPDFVAKIKTLQTV